MCSLFNQSGETCSLPRLHFFPRLEPVTSFPAWGTSFPTFGMVCVFSRAWQRVYLSGAWHLLHIFPRLPLVAHFPALATCYIFSRACQLLHIFLRLVQQYIFSCSLPFYVFPHLAPVADFGLLSSERFVVIIYILVLRQSLETVLSLLNRD